MTDEEREAFDRLMREKLATTVFLVEATDFECLALWRERDPRLIWKQDNPGTVVTVGHLDGRPVCVGLTWNIIHGKRILFWDATSLVVDYDMINEWLKENVPAPDWDGNRPARCDAFNFGHCLSAIGALDEIKNYRPRGMD